MSTQLNALKEFSRIPVLSNLSETEIFDFIRVCRMHRLPEGGELFSQGDSGRSMFLIESGNVDVFLEHAHGREHIAEFGALDVVGELSLLDPGPRSATAEARGDTVLYEVQGDDFEKMLNQLHPAAFKIVRSLSRIVCRRIRTVNTRIDAELSGTAPPPLHSGDYDRMTHRQATVTAAQAVVEQPCSPDASGKSTTADTIRRVIRRFWRSDE